MNFIIEEMVKLSDIQEWSTASKLFKRYETDKEYQDLNQFKVSHGLLSVMPIVLSRSYKLTRNGYLLIDGYNRLEAAKRSGEHSIKALVYEYDSNAEMEAHAIALNAKRRHLDAVTASRLALRLVELYKPSKEETKARQSSNAKNQHTSKKEGSTTPVVQPSKKKKSTLEKASKEVGVSPETVRKVKAIDKSGNKEVITAVETGKMSVKEGFKKVLPGVQKKVISSSKKNANDKFAWHETIELVGHITVLVSSGILDVISDSIKARIHEELKPELDRLSLIVKRCEIKSLKAS